MAADLYEILTKRADELRGRPADWRDHLHDWAAGVDWPWLAFVAFATPHVVALLVIEAWVVWLLVFGRG